MPKYLITLGDGTKTEMDAASIEEAPAAPAQEASEYGQRFGIREEFVLDMDKKFEDDSATVIVIPKQTATRDQIANGTARKFQLVYGPVEVPPDPGGQGDRG